MSEAVVSDVGVERDELPVKKTSLSHSYPYQRATAGRIIKYRIADIDKDEGDGEGRVTREIQAKQADVRLI